MAGRPIATAFVRLRFMADKATQAEADAQMQAAGATAAKQGEKAGKTFGQKMTAGLKSMSGLAAKAGAIGLGALAFEILKQGDALEKSQVRLNIAIRNTGGNARAAAPALDAIRAKMERWGFTNAETNQSLATLTAGTGSVSRAVAAQATAADLARYKNISLSSAADMLTKAYAGNMRSMKGLNVVAATGATADKAMTKAQADLADQISLAGGMAKFAAAHHMSLEKAQRLSKEAAQGSIPAMNKLGIVVLPASASAAQRFAQIQRVLNSRLGGQAKAAADTAGGAFAAMRATLTDMAAKTGSKVLPVLARILTWMNKSGILIPLTIALIVGLGAAMAASAIAAMSLATALTGGIALAVVAVIAGVILLIKHWKAVKGWFVDVWKWVQAHDLWALLIPGIGPLVLGLIKIAEHWRGLVTVAKNVWTWVNRIFVHWIPAAFDVMKDSAGLTLAATADTVLRWAYRISGIMGKLPGPLGAPWRAMHKAIGGELDASEARVKAWRQRVQADIAKFHDKVVKITFGLGANAPASLVSGVVRARTQHALLQGYARGTSGAAPGWAWVGEAGPELVRMTGGETVLSNPASMGATRGYASGVAGPRVQTAFAPPPGVALRAINQLYNAAWDTVVRWGLNHVTLPAPSGGGGGFGDSGVRSASAARAQAFARSIMGRYGWGPAQWPPWLYLGNQESGWNAYAVNASSGAYGIGQSLGHGHPYNLGDYVTQVIWMANYIRGRYGSPSAAWAHETAFNWYGKGGPITEPVIGFGTRTGRGYGFGESGTEQVVGAGDMATLIREVRKLQRIMGGVGGDFADQLNRVTRRAGAR
jgi:hypothetical protein